MIDTCIVGFWHSRADAYQGGLGPWHKKARVAGRELYESIVFRTFKLTVFEGVKGYRFEKWTE
jgi:heme-degrading monooxygenase HmoA